MKCIVQELALHQAVRVNYCSMIDSKPSYENRAIYSELTLDAKNAAKIQKLMRVQRQSSKSTKDQKPSIYILANTYTIHPLDASPLLRAPDRSSSKRPRYLPSTSQNSHPECIYRSDCRGSLPCLLHPAPYILQDNPLMSEVMI